MAISCVDCSNLKIFLWEHSMSGLGSWFEKVPEPLNVEKLPVPDGRERIVACLDLLGTKDILDKRGSAYLASAYSQAWSLAHQARSRGTTTYKVSAPMDELEEGLGEPMTQYVEEQGHSGPAFINIEHMVAFSDSIFLFGNDTSSDSVAAVSDLANSIFQLFLQEGLVVRGAISKGDCVLMPDRDIYVGMGIVKAYALQESSNIIGVVCDPEIDEKHSTLFRQIEVNVKPGKLLDILRHETRIEIFDKHCDKCNTPHTWAKVLIPRRLPEERKLGLDRNLLIRRFKELRDAVEGPVRKRFLNSYVLVQEMLDAPYYRW